MNSAEFFCSTFFGEGTLFTRLFCENTVEEEVITGETTGERILLPKIDLAPSDRSITIRRQFPVMATFAWNGNKSQHSTAVGFTFPNPGRPKASLY